MVREDPAAQGVPEGRAILVRRRELRVQRAHHRRNLRRMEVVRARLRSRALLQELRESQAPIRRRNRFPRGVVSEDPAAMVDREDLADAAGLGDPVARCRKH